MWVLNCEFEDENGVSRSRSIVLQRETECIIGRSVKSTLRIGEDKSISRIHLELKSEGNTLLVTNKGKLTYFKGTLAKTPSEFRIDQNCTFQIGSSPINIHLNYSLEEWKVPHSLHSSVEIQRLSTYGINVSYSFSRKSTLQIVSENVDPGGCLFAVVKGIPVLKRNFIDQITNVLESKNCTDFKTTFRALIRRNNIFPTYDFKINPLHNMSILVFDQKMFDMLKYTIEVGGGKLVFVETAFQLKTIIEKKDRALLAVVTNSFNPSLSFTSDVQKPNSELSKILQLNAIGLYTITQFVNLITSNLLECKVSQRSLALNKELPSSSTTDHIAGYLQKEKSESKVDQQTYGYIEGESKTLEGIPFFGEGKGRGGAACNEREKSHYLPIEPQHNKNMKEALCLESNIHSTSNEDHKTIYSNPLPAQFHPLSEHKKPRRRPLVKPLDNLMLRKTLSSEDQENNKNNAQEDSLKSSTLENSLLNVSHDNKLEDEESIHDNKIENKEFEKISKYSSKQPTANSESHARIFRNKSEYGETMNKDTDNELHIGKSFPARGVNIAAAILETKAIKNERTKATIVEIGKEELEADALQAFEDVAVVSKFSLKIRQPKISKKLTTSQSRTTSRNNFKRFTKVWPLQTRNGSGNTPTLIIEEKSKKLHPRMKLHIYDDSNKSSTYCDEFPSVEKCQHSNNNANDNTTFRYAHNRSTPPSTDPQDNDHGQQSLFVRDDEEEERMFVENRDVIFGETNVRSDPMERQEVRAPGRVLNKSRRVEADTENDSDTDEYGKPTFNFRSRVMK